MQATPGAATVLLRDGFATPLRSVAGCVLQSDSDGSMRAAVMLFDADSLAVLGEHRTGLRAPGNAIDDADAGVALLADALGRLSQRPDLLLVAGHGIAHPLRFGLASQLGVASDLPSIGIAGDILIGQARLQLHEMRGAFAPLRDGQEQIGWLLRSQPTDAALVVSPGHRVAMASAAELVMRFVRDRRFPEPLRQACTLCAADPGHDSLT